MKRTIKLTESDLRKIIKNTVSNILGDDDHYYIRNGAYNNDEGGYGHYRRSGKYKWLDHIIFPFDRSDEYKDKLRRKREKDMSDYYEKKNSNDRKLSKDFF